MEHLVQFSVSFDDETIIQKVVEQSTRQVVEEMTNECRRALGLAGSYRMRDGIIERMAEQIVRDCKDKIVESVSEELANRAPKQKWYREAMSKRFSERGGEQ